MVLATAVACGAIVAIAATEELDLLWVVLGADVAVGLGLATTVGLLSPLGATAPMMTAILRSGGLVALAQLVVGCLATPLARVPGEDFDWGWFGVPVLAVLMVALSVPSALLTWWLVALPVAAIVRGLPRVRRGDGRAVVEVAFSLLLLEIVALVVAQTGSERWGWTVWPIVAVGAAIVLTVAALAAIGYLAAFRHSRVI
ncbi:hypothetical protein [Nocardioides conyzicola]|uniref:Uncharacterized protein n=1 Tax=Nocardioides conyzicola TaxID=1651781 RepID=A0ABP8X2I8_9ACTN